MRHALRRTLPLLGLLLGLTVTTSSHAEAIVTGGTTGTYFKVGNNLKNIVDPRLEVKNTGGSWENVEQMSRVKGVTLATVQSDVYSAFVQMRDDPGVDPALRREYADLLKNLRVFMPLYPEEVHFLVRSNESIEFIHEIKGRAIWMDMEKSGTYLTAKNIYAKMFGERPNMVQPFLNPTATGDDEGTRRRRSALMALSNPDYYKAYPRIDVMVLVGGQPLGLLKENVPANLKLLKFDSKVPVSQALLGEYKAADILKSNYPALNIAGESSPTLSVDSYLITANFADQERNRFIQEFAGRFCAKFSSLQADGHPKWKAMKWTPGTALPSLARGWQYSNYVAPVLNSCTSSGSYSSGSTTGTCSPVDRYAGLCK